MAKVRVFFMGLVAFKMGGSKRMALLVNKPNQKTNHNTNLQYYDSVQKKFVSIPLKDQRISIVRSTSTFKEGPKRSGGNEPASKLEASSFGWVAKMKDFGFRAKDFQNSCFGNGPPAIVSSQVMLPNGNYQTCELVRHVPGKVSAKGVPQVVGFKGKVAGLAPVDAAMAEVVVCEMGNRGSEIAVIIEPIHSAGGVVRKPTFGVKTVIHLSQDRNRYGGKYIPIVIGHMPDKKTPPCRPRDGKHFTDFFDLLTPKAKARLTKPPFPTAKAATKGRVRPDKQLIPSELIKEYVTVCGSTGRVRPKNIDDRPICPLVCIDCP
ncbi:MAG: hypothetical protein OEY63_02615 [Gemmatimonadota bacterium]|nr:hypothetical protein [Gemmatimonadota bacterium]